MMAPRPFPNEPGIATSFLDKLENYIGEKAESSSYHEWLELYNLGVKIGFNQRILDNFSMNGRMDTRTLENALTQHLSHKFQIMMDWVKIEAVKKYMTDLFYSYSDDLKAKNDFFFYWEVEDQMITYKTINELSFKLIICQIIEPLGYTYIIQQGEQEIVRESADLEEKSGVVRMLEYFTMVVESYKEIEGLITPKDIYDLVHAYNETELKQETDQS